jgi:phosphoribosylformimino-5-aminoimidazole carboxamide ribotide isomerase
MIVIPALDLREGACVQLIGGDYAAERVRRDDPLEVLQDFARAGFSRAHVVDLDAATGRGANDALVAQLLAAPGLQLQVGGGVRDASRITTLLQQGATYVVCGTRAVEDPAWLDEMAQRFQRRLIVAADVRDRTVVTRGWQDATTRDVGDLLLELNALPLAAVLVTAVHVEGRLQGPDLALAHSAVATCRHPVLVAGGISTFGDLQALARTGVGAAIVGMALYTGALDARALAEEFVT